jgi:pimeloyl-ACP methyl ester carboxylesterase
MEIWDCTILKAGGDPMNKLSTEYVDLGDIRIAYRQHGSGRCAPAVHGNSGSKAMFKPYQLEHFPQFHTYALDSRGHGQSISTDEEITIEQISRDVIRFCEAKGIHQADVIGYSDGGNIALHLANKAPEPSRASLPSRRITWSAEPPMNPCICLATC